MTGSPIGTCVLGVGLGGLTFHVPFILALPDLFSLRAVLERNPASPGGKVHERFGVSPKIHRTLEAVLEDREIELVIVGTPNHTHYEFAKAALEAGKHVLVDKPVTTTSKEAKGLGELARRKGLVLYAFQNRRWDGDFLTLRSLLNHPPTSPLYLGSVVEFESHFDRYRSGLKGTWKDEALPGAGQTFDLGSHLIDQALQLFGNPDKVTGFMQNIRGIGSLEVDDSFTIHLHYSTDSAHPMPLTVILRGHILSARSPQVRYIVRGTQGSYVKYGVDPQEDRLKAITEPGKLHEPAFGREPEGLWGTLQSVEADGTTIRTTPVPTEDGSYVKLFRDLAEAVINGAETSVKWEEATSVVEMIELAHLSSRLGATAAARNGHVTG